MTTIEAIHSILGNETAHRIITEMGEHWAFCVALAVATTDADPNALIALRHQQAKNYVTGRYEP